MARACKLSYAFRGKKISYSAARNRARRLGISEVFNSARRVACKRAHRGGKYSWVWGKKNYGLDVKS